MMSMKNKHSPKKIGKPKEYGKPSSNKLKGNESFMDCPGRESVLTFPLLKTKDNDRLLPRYSVVLNRTEEEGVGMEDLDALQLELEALLSAVVVRTRVLQDEIGILNNAEENQRVGDKKSKLSISYLHKAPMSSGKKTKQDRPMKKLKDISAKSRGTDGNVAPLPIKITKVKSIPSAGNSRALPIALPDRDRKDYAPKVVLPKNDTPNKFWSSLEPYCTDFKPDDIKLLDDLIAERANNAEYLKVPPLGRHYSLRWAQEDLDEQSDSGPTKKKLKNVSCTVVGNSAKKSDPANPGPLTQRLSSCVMEENVMAPSQETFDVKNCWGGGENAKPQKPLAAGSSSVLEKQVRKELEEQELFDPPEPKDPADDEILAELRRCQAELKIISDYNINRLQRLKKHVTEEMIRQELKKKLQVADNEVLDVYRKITAAKQKKKPPTKEEVDHVWKSLKDREHLLKQIDKFESSIH